MGSTQRSVAWVCVFAGLLLFIDGDGRIVATLVADGGHAVEARRVVHVDAAHGNPDGHAKGKRTHGQLGTSHNRHEQA